MTTVDNVVRDYKDTLSQLMRNDKLRINVLTILAEDYAAYAPNIVKIIEESIFEVGFWVVCGTNFASSRLKPMH